VKAVLPPLITMPLIGVASIFLWAAFFVVVSLLYGCWA
jgi:predicted membrane metal-binding protein